MYTVHCEDPSCIKCKQALEGENSKEEVQSKFVKTEEELISMNLLSACKEKTACFETCRKLKDEVRYKINGLIDVLRERERFLCNELEQKYATQVTKIDHDVTVNCINKLLNRNSEHEKTACKFQLVFNSDFGVLKRVLKHFGWLSYERPSELGKTELLKMHETYVNSEKSQRMLDEDVAFSLCFDNPITKDVLLKSFATPLAVDSKATPKKNRSLIGSKDNESILKDLEELDRTLAEELFPETKKTEPKLNKEATSNTVNQNLKFGRTSGTSFEKLLLADLQAEEKRKMVEEYIKNNEESPKLTKLKSKDKICEDSSDEDDIEFINRSEADNIPSGFPFIPPLPPKNRCRFCRKRSCFAFLLSKKDFSSEKESKSESSGLGESGSRGSCSSTSSGSNAENASINKQAEQESSSRVSVDEGHNPSVALLSSFEKYFEKNRESEWLVPKTTEQFLSSRSSFISHKPVSFVKKDIGLYEWLSKKDNREMNSDWLLRS